MLKMNKLLSVILILLSLTTASALLMGKAPLIKIISLMMLLVTIAALNSKGGVYARWVGYINGLLLIVFSLISAEVVLFPEPGNSVDLIFLTLSASVGLLGSGIIIGIRSAATLPISETETNEESIKK
jgi:hypothetical protein